LNAIGRRFNSLRYLLRASRATFLSALTRVKQSGQAYRRPLPWVVCDNGRMLVESTKHLHSGHHFVFDAGALMGFTLQGTVPSPAMFSCPARDQALLPAPE